MTVMRDVTVDSPPPIHEVVPLTCPTWEGVMRAIAVIQAPS